MASSWDVDDVASVSKISLEPLSRISRWLINILMLILKSEKWLSLDLVSEKERQINDMRIKIMPLTKVHSKVSRIWSLLNMAVLQLVADAPYGFQVGGAFYAL